jgi:hypothetical protein
MAPAAAAAVAVDRPVRFLLLRSIRRRDNAFDDGLLGPDTADDVRWAAVGDLCLPFACPSAAAHRQPGVSEQGSCKGNFCL